MSTIQMYTGSVGPLLFDDADFPGIRLKLNEIDIMALEYNTLTFTVSDGSGTTDPCLLINDNDETEADRIKLIDARTSTTVFTVDNRGNIMCTGALTAGSLVSLHADTHQSGGDDEVALDISQISGGTADRVAIYTGEGVLSESSSVVASELTHITNLVSEPLEDNDFGANGLLRKTGAGAYDTITDYAPMSHAVNANTYGYGNNINAGHWRKGVGLYTSTEGTLSVDFGDGAGTACEDNDARLSDARTPTAHNQAASTITGGTVDAVAVFSSDTGILTSHGTVTATGLAHLNGVSAAVVQTDDARLSDARTPTTHSNTAHDPDYATESNLDSHTNAANPHSGVITHVAAANPHSGSAPTSHNQAMGTITGGGAERVAYFNGSGILTNHGTCDDTDLTWAHAGKTGGASYSPAHFSTDSHTDIDITVVDGYITNIAIS